jgi:hypothetical protein
MKLVPSKEELMVVLTGKRMVALMVDNLADLTALSLETK